MVEELKQPDNKPTFCLLHGSWHGAWCWSFVKRELRLSGFKVFTPELNLSNPNLSFNDHANTIRRALIINGVKETVMVPWSSAANIAPRALGTYAVKKIINVAGSFHPATLRRSVTGEPLPARSMSYEILRREGERGFYELADYVFYNDIENEALKDAAKKRLKWYPRRDAEPALVEFPAIPAEYILLTKDNALVPECQTDIAEALGVDPVRFESGHAPMLSRPKELAGKLIELATRN